VVFQEVSAKQTVAEETVAVATRECILLRAIIVFLLLLPLYFAGAIAAKWGRAEEAAEDIQTQGERIVAEGTRECDRLREEATRDCARVRAEADTYCARVREGATRECARLRAEATRECARRKEDADRCFAAATDKYTAAADSYFAVKLEATEAGPYTRPLFGST
jgi:cell division septum initiation protein DivIVA